MIFIWSPNKSIQKMILLYIVFLVFFFGGDVMHVKSDHCYLRFINMLARFFLQKWVCFIHRLEQTEEVKS